MAEAIERYQKLELRDALSLCSLYPMACKELNFILCSLYSNSHKSLQSLLFDDTLLAFRLLPLMQTDSAVKAAKLLMQSAAAAFPEMERQIAYTHFKKAKVAYQRLTRTQQDNLDHIELPEDVLMHLFSFLDMQSLVSAGMVCRSWHATANDNCRWKCHYTTHFGDSDNFFKAEGLLKRRKINSTNAQSRKCTSSNGLEDWRYAFKIAYIGRPSSIFKSNRGYCIWCNSIVWLNNLKCPKQHSDNRQPRPVDFRQIVRYVDVGSYWRFYYSDSHSESDDEEDELDLA